MSLRTPDFESGAYTNFATPAANIEGKDNKSNTSRIATGASRMTVTTTPVFSPRLQALRLSYLAMIDNFTFSAVSSPFEGSAA